MNDTERTNWILLQRGRTWDAIHILASAKKEITSEYDARLRILKDLEQKLFIRKDDKQAEMFELDDLLPPNVAKLLESPTHGLT